MIETRRLHLIPFEIDQVVALGRGRQELGVLLGVDIPDGWPQFPEAYSVENVSTAVTQERDSSLRIWGTYLFVLSDRSWLVGSGGYKGRPVGGVVEIGYEMAPDFQNQGFATEATRALIDHAFSHSEIECVIAHTLPERNASTTVLEKVGMALVEAVIDPDEGVVWQWRLSKPGGDSAYR